MEDSLNENTLAIEIRVEILGISLGQFSLKQSISRAVVELCYPYQQLRRRQSRTGRAVGDPDFQVAVVRVGDPELAGRLALRQLPLPS